MLLSIVYLCLGIYYLLQDVCFIILFLIFTFLACKYFYCGSHKHKRYICYCEVNDLIKIYSNCGKSDDFFGKFYKEYHNYQLKCGILKDEYFIGRLNDWLDVTDLKDIFTYFGTLISLLTIASVFFKTEIKVGVFFSKTTTNPILTYPLIVFVLIFVSSYIYFRHKKSKVLHILRIITYYSENKELIFKYSITNGG